MVLSFIKTCSWCPEQYTVVDENKNVVGYVRYRYGKLSVECPFVDGSVKGIECDEVLSTDEYSRPKGLAKLFNGKKWQFEGVIPKKKREEVLARCTIAISEWYETGSRHQEKVKKFNEALSKNEELKATVFGETGIPDLKDPEAS